jgi:hypothetical protein
MRTALQVAKKFTKFPTTNRGAAMSACRTLPRSRAESNHREVDACYTLTGSWQPTDLALSIVNKNN